MRKLKVLGVELKDYSVREAMRRITLYLNNGACNTVDFVSHDALLKASGDEDLKSNIETMDLVIPVSSDILQAGSIFSRSREREIESNLFFKGFLRKLEKERRSVFLISSTSQKLESLSNTLGSFFGPLNVVSGAASEETVGGGDFLVNEINSCLPEVVILNLESPLAEQFIVENSMKLNCQLIVVVRDVSLRVSSDGNVKRGGLGGFLARRFFRNAAINYEKENNPPEDTGEYRDEDPPEKIINLGN